MNADQRIASRLASTLVAWGLHKLPEGADPVVDALWSALDLVTGDRSLTIMARAMREGGTSPAMTPGEALAALQAAEWERARLVTDLDALEHLRRACRAARAFVPLVAPEWPDRRDWSRAASDELVVALLATVRSWSSLDGIDAAHWFGFAGWITTASVALAPGLAERETERGPVTYPPLTVAEWCAALDAATQRLAVELSPSWQRASLEGSVALRELAVAVAERAS